MPKPISDFLAKVVLCLVIILGLEILFLGFNASDPGVVKPGDQVAVLTGKSVMNDGSVCQQYYSAQISPTSKEGELKWFKAQRFWFPVHQYVSVIYPNGTIQWVFTYNIKKLPAEESLLLCPLPVQQ